ncbi:MAG TPA: zinc ribbon domain-containing protein [Pyrinomonadaceae bacterium]
MYCPKCATFNDENGKFCRACGAGISFVSQALTGNVPSSDSLEASRQQYTEAVFRNQKPASQSRGIISLFLGLSFLLVAAAVYGFAPAGEIWWFWFLLPAFAGLGVGVADILRFTNQQRLLQKATGQTTLTERPMNWSLDSIYSRQPPSVTEDTTKTLRMPSGHENS